MKATLGYLLLSTSLLISPDISMYGVKIGDAESSLKKIKLEVIAKEDNITKYRTENNNDFSVTTSDKRVVYMENDWLQDSKSKKPLFTDFEFGSTSLQDIRNTFGSNGFTYRARGSFTTKTDVITFNCYELDSPNNEILVVITKASLKDNLNEDNIAEKLKLDAIIIANTNYLDEIWDKEKVYDPKNIKVKL
ncbi:hypothetical protein [Flavobacterium terrisoli]|uniref:hypothetical protein n=1 Tax=Flavobacterium terrisoli TaxID=3242195 RepID=UPI002543D01B|nr:hypothetical protein [Flavobacterium buctense]